MRYFVFFLFLFANLVLSAQTVRVLTYNIHHANPPSKPGVIDIDAIAEVINAVDADVIGIQEVDVNVPRSGTVDQAKRLAELTNTNYFFSKGIDLDNGEYGILILTKHKITGQRRYDLPMPVKSENRSLAIVDIALSNGKTISLANTHLDLKDDNKIAQAKFINDLVDGYKHPLILVGDLNASPTSVPIQLLEQKFVRNKKDNGPTFPNVNTKEEIDYILISKPSKFKWKKYKVVDASYPSDHLPLSAEIVMK
ncbi:Metal-dependent hydrolase, endonuclease/exonuclease/phosphatase family [Sphingobacterium nematocida]|uniref:Metal-dependent hydrolase, endonuclease/exonuclease/phosphatase family n=1 Tax=Sphingobacterium nematocida TaxID=1513896 RepID=A0A1T5DAT6_9SPHI|nr:endonuclease/exonuclease/phosphatase family protein [Sphingobacterium nematocida]SKB68697.1 Metal-dependent hydrolase, endonuclease/exonuclease/phosphatase family [Sphingobacterium nematocida]